MKHPKCQKSERAVGGRSCRHSSQTPCWGHHSNPRALFNSLNNLRLHTRRWISRPLFSCIRTSKLLQKMTCIHVIHCYSMPYPGIPLVISTYFHYKMQVVNPPQCTGYFLCTIFFLWSRLLFGFQHPVAQEPPGWNGFPLPPTSPSPPLSVPSPWRLSRCLCAKKRVINQLRGYFFGT